MIKEIKEKIHGVVSLLFFGIAVSIGFLSILLENINFASFYTFVLLSAPFAICYFYCLKCPCRISNCAHIFPGKITRLFKSKRSGKYSFIDYFITASIIFLLIGMPQYWLFQKTALFIIFWALVVIAVFEARSYVCTRCQNSFCPASKLKTK